ncbi:MULTISPECIES: MgtC/SapB family protein [Paenibacillus]|uniref:MgtC/SapB family protein n=1 Tax=Paenibacillus TaxID=44249 RepID=UPI0022B8B289|nr:MgtC/SapB family protein [Paenibacillus caseinilyticus]MCZ8519067.1 MgtC/SapB family protein [Paenibacillus caseinilyticus]
MDSELILRLGFALFLGLLIGIDRELRQKPLGMKTSMVIAVGSCLITIVSIYSVDKFSIDGRTQMDPMRLAAQIVSGIGFIGAGAILRRSNDVISGLTTAAMVWASAALGIAAGAGFYKEAFTAVAMIMLAVNLFPVVVKLLGPRRLREKYVSVKVEALGSEELSGLVAYMDSEYGLKHLKIKDIEGDRQRVHFYVVAPATRSTTAMYYNIKRLKQVLHVEVEDVSP